MYIEKKKEINNGEEWQKIKYLTFLLVTSWFIFFRFFFSFEYIWENEYSVFNSLNSTINYKTMKYILFDSSFDFSNVLKSEEIIDSNNFFLSLFFCSIAKIIEIFGFSLEKSIMYTLIYLPFFFGMVNIFLIYFLGKTLFDEITGLISIFFYSFAPIVIKDTFISNGQGSSFQITLYLLFLIFIFKAIKMNENDEMSLVEIMEKKIMKYVLIMSSFSGFFLGLSIIFFSSSFEVFKILIIVYMVKIGINCFFTKKNFEFNNLVYILVIVVGVGKVIFFNKIFGFGSWEKFFFKYIAFLLYVVGMAILSELTKKYFWIIFLPIIIILNIFVINYWNHYIYLYEIFYNSNNNIFEDENISVSFMAGGYGFITFWIPYIFILVNIFFLMGESLTERGSKKIFIIIWSIFSLIFSWKVDKLFLSLPIYFILIAESFNKSIKFLKLKEYFYSLLEEEVSFKERIKRCFKGVQLYTMIIVILLVIIPNIYHFFIFGIPTNSSKKIEFNILNKLEHKIYDEIEGDVKLLEKLKGEGGDKRILAPLEFSILSSVVTNIDTVLKVKGKGSSLLAHIALANSEEEIISLLIMDMIVENKIIEVEDEIIKKDIGKELSDIDIKRLKEIKEKGGKDIENETEIKKYFNIKNEMSRESAIYFYGAFYLTNEAGEEECIGYDTNKLVGIHEKIRSWGAKEIGYIVLTKEMLPMDLNKNSLLNKFIEMKGHEYDEEEKVFHEYYSVSVKKGKKEKEYEYKEKMYNSLIWQMFLGGENDKEKMPNRIIQSYNNFEIFYLSFCYVKEEKDLELKEKCNEMNYKDAEEKKKEEGGFINFFNKPIVLKWSPHVEEQNKKEG